MMRTIAEVATDLAKNRMAREALNVTNVYGADQQRMTELETRRIELNIQAERLFIETQNIINAMAVAKYQSPPRG